MIVTTTKNTTNRNEDRGEAKSADIENPLFRECCYCGRKFKVKSEEQIYCTDGCYYKDDEETYIEQGRSEIGGY
jgi:hypothetical protein